MYGGLKTSEERREKERRGNEERRRAGRRSRIERRRAKRDEVDLQRGGGERETKEWEAREKHVGIHGGTSEVIRNRQTLEFYVPLPLIFFLSLSLSLSLCVSRASSPPPTIPLRPPPPSFITGGLLPHFLRLIVPVFNRR